MLIFTGLANQRTVGFWGRGRLIKADANLHGLFQLAQLRCCMIGDIKIGFNKDLLNVNNAKVY